MTRFISFFGLFFLLSFNVAAESIGVVIYSKGDVTVSRDNEKLGLKRRDPVVLGDHIQTGEDGKFSAKLKDGSVITLGNDSDFIVREYVYSPEKEIGKAIFETTKGAFRAVTGAIQKAQKSDYIVHTPLAVIGVRGTDFWGGFIFGDQLDVTVLSGKGVYVENDKGKVLLTKGEGTTVKQDELTPSKPKVWPDEKMQKAVASVTLD